MKTGRVPSRDSTQRLLVLRVFDDEHGIDIGRYLKSLLLGEPPPIMPIFQFSPGPPDRKYLAGDRVTAGIHRRCQNHSHRVECPVPPDKPQDDFGIGSRDARKVAGKFDSPLHVTEIDGPRVDRTHRVPRITDGLQPEFDSPIGHDLLPKPMRVAVGHCN